MGPHGGGGGGPGAPPNGSESSDRVIACAASIGYAAFVTASDYLTLGAGRLALAWGTRAVSQLALRNMFVRGAERYVAHNGLASTYRTAATAYGGAVAINEVEGGIVTAMMGQPSRWDFVPLVASGRAILNAVDQCTR